MKKTIILGAIACSLLAAGCSKAPVANTNQAPSTTQNNTKTSSNSTATKSYSLADVKAHSKHTDCWLAIKGSVYDVTSFIPRHPGGPARIIPLCGTDATANFTEQHDGQPKPEDQLVSLKIGTLK